MTEETESPIQHQPSQADTANVILKEAKGRTPAPNWLKVKLLMSAALVLCLAAISLLLTGLLTSYWMKGRDSLGQFHYGLFSHCREGGGCISWSEVYGQEKPHSLPRERRVREEEEDFTPPDISACAVMLCLDGIALLGSNAILLWFLIKAPTNFWAKNALECTVSGILHGTIGITIFLIGRLNKEEKKIESKTLSWSAHVVTAAVVSQVLAVLCISLPILKYELPDNTQESVSTSISTMSPIKLAEEPDWAKSTRPISRKGSIVSSTDENKLTEKRTHPELMMILQHIREAEKKSKRPSYLKDYDRLHNLPKTHESTPERQNASTEIESKDEAAKRELSTEWNNILKAFSDSQYEEFPIDPVTEQNIKK